MSRSVATKSLKDQNRWQIWLVIAANSLFLYGVIQANVIELNGLKSIFTDAQNFLSVGFAVLITTVISGFLSAETKARVVFLRWHFALLGHRAFSFYAVRDTRIDLDALRKQYGTLPADPADQNRLWYRIFKSKDQTPEISQVHRDFLLLRDYTAISLLCLLIYGAFAIGFIASGRICVLYLMLLVLQLIVVRQAAFYYGIRMVTNTLALAAVQPTKVAKPRPAKPKA